MTASVEQENFYRHSTIIVDHVKDSFTNLLEYYLDQQGTAGITLRQFILNNRHDIYHLFDTRNACCLCPAGTRFYARGARPLLFRSQMEILFDNSSSTSSSAPCNKFCCAPVNRGLKLKHLDITLAYTLLTEFTNVVPRGTPERKALDSLKEKRNDAHAHAKEGRIPNDKYKTSMDSIESDLTVLAKVYGQETEIKGIMDSVRKQPFNTELYRALQETLERHQTQMNEISDELKRSLTESESRKRKQPEETVNLDKFLGDGLQELIGTREEGEFDRGNGNMVTWSFKGIIQGFQWKYRGTCVDRTTGKSCTAIKQSRKGSIEHALRGLFQQLNITDVKVPERFR